MKPILEKKQAESGKDTVSDGDFLLMVEQLAHDSYEEAKAQDANDDIYVPGVDSFKGLY